MGELTSLLQGVHLPCWISDEDGVFVWVNDAFVSTFGDRRGEHYSTVVAPESMEAAAQHFEHLHDDPATEHELNMMLADGRRVRTEISSILLEDVGLCCGGFGLAGLPAQPRRPAAHTRLTPRQLEVLLLLSDGASTDQIAEELYLSKETVRNHIRQILVRLHVHSRLEAVVKARREALV